MRYVLDCSVAVRWFVPQTHWQVAARVFQRFRDNELILVAPAVIIPEFGHVLRKLVIGKKATAEREDLRVLTAGGPMTRAFAKLDRTLHLVDYPIS